MHTYVLGPTQSNFKVKMSPEKSPKDIYAQEHVYYYYNFGNHLETSTEKNYIISILGCKVI